jgi:hypothetical protein
VKKFISWVLIIMLLAAPGCAGKKSIPAAPKQGAITLAYEFPRDTKHIEVYIGLATGFTPTGWDGSAWTGSPNTIPNWDGSTNTLFAVVAPAKKFNISGLTPGVIYYARLVVVDMSGQRSAPSIEMSGAPLAEPRSSTLIIAAADASPLSKAGADYVCTGSGDQDTINAAIDALPVIVKETGTAQAGGLSYITLAASTPAILGEYNQLTVVITGGTGAGQSRQITRYEIDRKAYVSPNWDTPPDNTSVYRIEGKIGEIKFTEGRFILSGSINIKSYVTYSGAGHSTIFDGRGSPYQVFTESDTYRSAHVVLKDFAVMPDNNGVGGTSLGIQVPNTYNTLIKNVMFYAGDGESILAGGNNITIENCIFNGVTSGTNVIEFAGIGAYTVCNCTFNNGKTNIYAGLSSGGSVDISNNIFSNGGAGSIGIYVYSSDYTAKLMASSNQISGMHYYGIYCIGASYSIISKNSLIGNGWEAGNYGNIVLDTNCDQNVVSENLCRKGTGNQSKYGIKINNANCDRNLISNNDCYLGGVTAGISNAGTNTSFGAGNRNNDGTWSTTPN